MVFSILKLTMSVEQISIVLASFGVCLGVLICFILLLANKTQVHANRLLAVTVFSLTLAMVQAALIYSGYLLRIPHYFRISSPFFYLSLATSYLYVRSVINDETRFKRFDFVLFLPAILHFVEMIPFYLKPATEKQIIIDRLLQDPGQIVQLNEGLLPPYFHNYLRSIIGLIYSFLMIRLMVRARHEKTPNLVRSPTYDWLKWFIGLVTLAVLSTLLILLLPDSLHFNKTLGVHLSVIICFVILNFYLFFRPQILYGIPRVRMENVRVKEGNFETRTSNGSVAKASRLVGESVEAELHDTSGATLDYLLAYKPILELHLETNKPYLQQGYNIAKLSSETGIPQHHLSALLNKVYGVRFNDFINQYRIRHISTHFDKGGWEQMTIEGIASEAGFNSRTTFFNAIKKSTGLSPSEYINNIRSEKEGQREN